MKKVILILLAMLLMLSCAFGEVMEIGVVQDGDIVTNVSREDRTHYIKVGTLVVPDGYIRKEAADENGVLIDYFIEPADGTEPFTRLTIASSFIEAEYLTDNVLNYMVDIVDCAVYEKQQLTIQDRTAWYYGADYTYQDETTGETVYCQTISFYMTVSNGMTLAAHAYRTGPDDSCYLPEEERIPFAESLSMFFIAE